ncbi:cysteine desulfurase family protein [Algirhabdus cladophorae]|uniref:cysteine desulfurase family protein n=1 Tax=Algirhabdus cladophorae TaxID=3377108 RepID=UPI003B84984B
MTRVYLDHNATTALVPAAREAMLKAMDSVGNPSSVHAEGRGAKRIVETARQQITLAMGANGADVIFTSSATESAALALGGRALASAPIEHDAVLAWTSGDLPVTSDGTVAVSDPAQSTLQLANSETGVVQALPNRLALSDMTQGFGKIPVAFDWSGVTAAMVSAHKIGGPKGVGALVIKQGTDVEAQIKGGGQEMGRRSGTENVIGIAGFGAAATAATQALSEGEWEKTAQLRDLLEEGLEALPHPPIFYGKGASRLPNTSCFVARGWKGETQVMLMDLAGFAVSAGSACSSGKVKPSGVLRAMGADALDASCALRVSLGPRTTKDEIERFVDAWSQAYEKHRLKAA